MMLRYPQTKKVEQLDDYHGTKIADPYRWLEQSADTPEVRAWIEAQNKLTSDFLSTIPARAAIHKRLTEAWDYPKSSAPFKKGRRYFQFRNSGLQNQAVLYVMEQPQAEGRVLLDPNALSEDGTAALNAVSVSKDGRYLAYAVAESGSDWQHWHIRDIDTGQDLPEVLEHSKFSSVTWLPDNSGFYYSRFPAPDPNNAYINTNENETLWFHKLATPQTEDSIVYQRPDEPQWRFAPQLSDDERYLILHVSRGTERRNLIYYRVLESRADFKELISTWEAQFLFLGNDGDVFYFETDYGADRHQIIAIDIKQPEPAHWRSILPEQPDTIQTAKLIGDDILAIFMHHASDRLRRFDKQGKLLAEIALPGLGSIPELMTERSDNEVFYSFTSFLHPTIHFCYEVKSGKSEQLSSPQINFDTSAYTTRQVFVSSKDGTKVPMFLVHKKDLELSGQNPTLLYGYGGFQISLTPEFSISRLIWLDLGGVLAVANLRGGGEYGRSWYEAGTLERKQNVFDDFVACAEWLIDEGISSSQKLAIQGGSNGGLLVGAVMTQRPELFAAALPAVGVLDMLRFHQFTIGWAWTSDFGSADNPEQFQILLNYSPLHRLKAGTAYPATLITTGDHDDRVVPAHSFKFAAALQEAHRGEAPILIRVQTKAGHGMGKPTKMLIDEVADVWAFLVRVLGMG